MATLEIPLLPQVESYLDYFNRPDTDLTSCKAYYVGRDDKLVITISSNIHPHACKSLKISIPVCNASIFCLELDAEGFKDRIISTILSVFSHYNAS